MRDLTIAVLLATSVTGGAIAGANLDGAVRRYLTPESQRLESFQLEHAHVTKHLTLSQGKRETINNFYLSNGRNMQLEIEYRGIDPLTGFPGLYFNGVDMTLTMPDTIIEVNSSIGHHGLYIKAKLNQGLMELDVMNYNELVDTR